MSAENKIQRYKPAAVSVERRYAPVSSLPERMGAELEPELRTYWRVICNRRRTIVAVFLSVFAGVMIGTLAWLIWKPTYRSTALLEIGQEKPDIETMNQLIKVNPIFTIDLETQYGVLASDNLAEQTIRQLKLDQLEEFNPPKGWWSDWIWWASPPNPQKTFERVLKRFQKRLNVDPVKNSRLVEVSFDSQDPQLAAQIVNTLVSDYLQLRLEGSQKSTDWLSKQLEIAKAQLEKSQTELEKYARENKLLYLENEKGEPENIINDRLRQLQAELTRAQADLYQKESLHHLVQRGDYASLPGVVDNKLMQDLTSRLAELQRAHAELTSTFTADYPKVKEVKNQIDQLEAVLSRERQRAAQRMTNDYDAAVRRESLVRRAFYEQQGAANVIAVKATRYKILRNEVDTNKQLYEDVMQKVKEAKISAGLTASNVRIIDSGEPRLKPYRPNIPLNLALAVVLGLGLGLGVAFLQEHFDTTLKTPEDVGRFLDVPALAMIPSVELSNAKQRPLLATGGGKQAPALATRWQRINGNGNRNAALAEAFGTLRTSVLLDVAGSEPPRSLLVSSSQPGEGKTTVSVNLAIALAKQGQRVLLVDGDLRRPSVHKALDMDSSTGLTSYLTGQRLWPTVVRPTFVSGLHALTAGPAIATPGELLASPRMETLLSEASVAYNFVILDSPALLLNLADACVLASLVDGVLLVVRGGFTPRELVKRARERVPNVIGVVLNNLDIASVKEYYGSYYGNGYEAK